MNKHPRTDEYRAAFDLPRDEMACFAETLEAELAAARRLAAQWQTEALESRKAIETLTEELAAVWRAMRDACEYHHTGGGSRTVKPLVGKSGAVAQGLERRPYKPVVGGSIPPSPTIANVDLTGSLKPEKGRE